MLPAAAGAAAARPGEAGREVAVFYYPWYGTPERDGEWLHWGQNGHRPPGRLASAYYPSSGPYSSADPAVVARHMDDLVAARATTVVVSWWGEGSREDALLPLVLREASLRTLKVAVHVEPYPGRTPATVEADIARLRPRGITDFYVYDSTLHPDLEWADANLRLDGVRVFAHTWLPGRAAAGKFDGLYTYDVLTHDGSSFKRVCASARSLGLLCAPSVGPGFDARAATPELRVRERGSGATYDRMWSCAVRAGADLVTVTSYNEWHEGSQIEPARGYDGAWGLAGAAAERAYLQRTAYWAERFAAGQYSAAASLRR